ncbi:hypothetical protein ABFS83_07G050700 [Erythranthe nasuta]
MNVHNNTAEKNIEPLIASQPIGPQNSRFPIRPVVPATYTSESTKLSNSQFPKAFGASASQSIPGNSDLAFGTTNRGFPETAPKNYVEGSFTDYTEPYIMQLERSIEEVMGGRNDVNNPDETDIDLTLKL